MIGEKPRCTDPEGCTNQAQARGLCRKHYQRAHIAGLFAGQPRAKRERFECPPEHAHDLDGCWGAHGCRCDGCQHLRRMERQRRRKRLRASGREELITARVPVIPVRDHLLLLRDVHGLGLERIADASGIARGTLDNIVYGKGARNRMPLSERTIDPAVAAIVLDIRPSDVPPAKVDATGTIRRLRALVAIGYLQSDLSRCLGWDSATTAQVTGGRRKRVSSETAAAVRALFDELWDAPLTGTTEAQRARRQAAVKGWQGPLAWDDIDNPAESAVGAGVVPDGPVIDEVAIQRAMSGERTKLTAAERRVAVARMHALRYSDHLMAARIGCGAQTVGRIREDLGLPAWDPEDVVRRDAA